VFIENPAAIIKGIDGGSVKDFQRTPPPGYLSGVGDDNLDE